MPVRNEGDLVIIEPSERCLSEAIVDGMKQTPIARGDFVKFDDNGKCCGACAIGAAIYAELGPEFCQAIARYHSPLREHGPYGGYHWNWSDVAQALWPYIDDDRDDLFDEGTLEYEVYGWNDSDELTRAQTAARVRKAEQALGVACSQ